MSDKDLLELAAKAAGIEVEWKEVTRSRIAEFKIIKHEKHCGFFAKGKEWNPLTDDGDALRLAVKLHINIEVWNVDNLVRANIYILHRGHGCFEEHYTTNPYAATRRAIVRAAAEIGKGIVQTVSIDLPEDNYYKTQAEAVEVAAAAIRKGE